MKHCKRFDVYMICYILLLAGPLPLFERATLDHVTSNTWLASATFDLATSFRPPQDG
jgi:hypothetical protein